MAEFGQLDIYGSLNIKDNLFVRNNIIQDDILYLILSSSLFPSDVSASLFIKVRKKDNILTTSVRQVNFKTATMPTYLMPARPAIHFWYSTSNLGVPTALPVPTVIQAPVSGTLLEPITISNSAIVFTALTNNNHEFVFNVSNSNITSNYLMASVQGIVYSLNFIVGV